MTIQPSIIALIAILILALIVGLVIFHGKKKEKYTDNPEKLALYKCIDRKSATEGLTLQDATVSCIGIHPAFLNNNDESMMRGMNPPYN
jgi:hypothetical protein